jgi:NTE family protein
VINNTPISHALDLGASQVYVLPAAGPCALTEAPRGALAMLVHATALMLSQRFVAEVITLAGRADITILPPPCPVDIQPTDFAHAEQLMTRAEADANAFLHDRRRRVVTLPHRRPPRPAVDLPATG